MTVSEGPLVITAEDNNDSGVVILVEMVCCRWGDHRAGESQVTASWWLSC